MIYTYLFSYWWIRQKNCLGPVFIVMHPITNVKRCKPYFDPKFKNKPKNFRPHLLRKGSLNSSSSFMILVKKIRAGFHVLWRGGFAQGGSYCTIMEVNLIIFILWLQLILRSYNSCWQAFFPVRLQRNNTASDPEDQRVGKSHIHRTNVIQLLFTIMKLPSSTSKSFCMFQEKLKEETRL